MPLTFAERFLEIWEPFCALSHDPEKTNTEVEEAEKDCDNAIEALLDEFSHPPSKPNRRR